MTESLSSRFTVNGTNARQDNTGFAAAPMPNQDASAPRIANSKGAEVSPAMLGAKTNVYRGDGFMPGSSPLVAQQPKRMPMPGISLKVPLY
jgi:hypothetical protein